MSSSLDPTAEARPKKSKGRPSQKGPDGRDLSRVKPRGISRARPDGKLTAREAIIARFIFQGLPTNEIAAAVGLTVSRTSMIVNQPHVLEEVQRLQTLADTEIIKTVRDRAVQIQTKLYDEFDSTFKKVVDLRDTGGPRDSVQFQAAKLLFERAFDTNVIPATVRAKLATETMNAKNQPPTLNIFVTANEAQGVTKAIDDALELTPGLDYTDAPETEPANDTDAPNDEDPSDDAPEPA